MSFPRSTFQNIGVKFPRLSRHLNIFKIRMIEVFNYRLRALVWFAVGLVNTLVLLFFWWAALSGGDSANTNTTLTIPAITTYYLLMTSLATTTICHQEEDISNRDIYKGNLYGYLLQPYPYLLAKFQEEIVWRLLGGFWALLTIIIVTALGFNLTISASPFVWLLTFLSASMGIMVSYFWKSILGLLAIWLTNLQGLLDLEGIFQIILAGFILPLNLLPQPLQNIALFSPWAAPVYYPIAILAQSLPMGTIITFFAMQLFWMIVFGATSKLVFKKGLLAYTGVSQ